MIINASQKLINIVNSPIVKNHLDRALTSDVYAARTLLVANVAKDAVETGFNIYQTLKNDNISKSQKKFIATYDAAEGALTWVTQLATGLTIANSKVQTKIYNKLFGSFKNTAPDLFTKGKAGFAIATSLIASTVIAKRIIVPFFASLFASHIKNKLEDKYCD